jgi:hypothetical protein
MRVMCLRKYAPRVPLYASVALPTNRKHFEFLADHVLCLEELKLGMLAQNCGAPGFSTIIIHLTISVTEETIQSHLDMQNASWATGYGHSISQELYPCSLELFKGYLFKEVVIEIYVRHNALLIGIYTSENGKVYINPRVRLGISKQSY